MIVCIALHWKWLWHSTGAQGVAVKPLLLSASRRWSKPAWVVIIQCPFSLNVDLYSCSCTWFLSDFSWPHAAAQSQINKDLCWQLLQKLLVFFRDSLFSSCAQGCWRHPSTSAVCSPVQFWPFVVGKSNFFVFFCKLTAARIVFCLILLCSYWMIENVFYQWRVCLGLFWNQKWKMALKLP